MQTAPAADVVSVIVTTRNSIRTIERCLASIRAQDYPHIELILVDNFSTDGTKEAGEKLVDLFVSAGPERCAQRNLAIRRATGRYVMILDSDMFLPPGLVSAAVAAHQEQGAAGVALLEESFGSGFWAQCKALERSCYLNDPLMAGARFYTRERLLEVGGYDENLIIGEDWDLSIRAVGSGKLAFAEGIILHDEGKLTLTDLAKKKFYYGRFLPMFIGKHGGEALRRLSPARGSLLRNLGVLAGKPLVGAGVVIMKATEMTAGVAGMALALSQTGFSNVGRRLARGR
jgi:glycosyltransferase involved in cell wall biosynthesis